MKNEHLTYRILARILPLMPTKRRNSDEDAEFMRRRMDQIVQEEFEKEDNWQDEIPF